MRIDLSLYIWVIGRERKKSRPAEHLSELSSSAPEGRDVGPLEYNNHPMSQTKMKL